MADPITGDGIGGSDGGAEQIDSTPAHQPPKLAVDVADLRRRLGQRLDIEVMVRLLPQSVVASRTTDEPVVGTVTVESIERGVSVTGSVEFSWEGDCRRCLDITGGSLPVDIGEIFQVDAPEDSELIDFDGEQIDLVPIVHDAVVLSLPLAPLCRDDCAGPDPDRYPALTQSQAEEARAEERKGTTDPRWAALDQLDLGSEN